MKQFDLGLVNILNARQILHQATEAYTEQVRHFPREKITKRIEELKYLTAQRTFPKLSVRKEILHLEDHLKAIFSVEKAVAEQQRKESTKITELKKQNVLLRKRLAATEDRDLQQKVDRLSHLLAEVNARKDIEKDVVLQQIIAKELRDTTVAPLRETRNEKIVLRREAELQKPSLLVLQEKVEALRNLLGQKKDTGAAPELIQLLETKIQQLEEKISVLLERQPSLVRHTFVMDGPIPKKADGEMEEELPSLPFPK